MILLQKMHQSGILRFDDNVNDMNFWSRLKFTNKGPHSLGGNNSNNIGINDFWCRNIPNCGDFSLGFNY